MDRYCKFAWEYFDSVEGIPDCIAFGDGPQSAACQLMSSAARNLVVFYDSGLITFGEAIW